MGKQFSISELESKTATELIKSEIHKTVPNDNPTPKPAWNVFWGGKRKEVSDFECWLHRLDHVSFWRCVPVDRDGHDDGENDEWVPGEVQLQTSLAVRIVRWDLEGNSEAKRIELLTFKSNSRPAYRCETRSHPARKLECKFGCRPRWPDQTWGRTVMFI